MKIILPFISNTLMNFVIGLLLARHVQRVLGVTGSNVVGRVLGVLLAALAAQITLDGLRQSLGIG